MSHVCLGKLSSIDFVLCSFLRVSANKCVFRLCLIVVRLSVCVVCRPALSRVYSALEAGGGAERRYSEWRCRRLECCQGLVWPFATSERCSGKCHNLSVGSSSHWKQSSADKSQVTYVTMVLWILDGRQSSGHSESRGFARGFRRTDLGMTPELTSGWGSSEVTGDFVVFKTWPAYAQDGRYPVLSTTSGGQEGWNINDPSDGAENVSTVHNRGNWSVRARRWKGAPSNKPMQHDIIYTGRIETYKLELWDNFFAVKMNWQNKPLSSWRFKNWKIDPNPSFIFSNNVVPCFWSFVIYFVVLPWWRTPDCESMRRFLHYFPVCHSHHWTNREEEIKKSPLN